MSEVKERMINEYNELKEKFEKLTAFIQSEKIKHLSEDEVRLLCTQGSAMNIYLLTLKKRIDIFKEKDFNKEEQNNEQTDV